MTNKEQKKSRIGLVLAGLPAYSETFFNNKINGLLERGNELVLFLDKPAQQAPAKWKLVNAPRVSRSVTPAQLFRFLGGLLWLMLRHSRTAWRLFRLERQDGHSLRHALETVYLNQHFLAFRGRLDWLHFGFATRTLRRENVARAIGAQMSTSLRGFDISIYPLRHPGCYDRLWRKLDKVHTISEDLLGIAHRNGLSTDTRWQKITPAIEVDRFVNAQRRFFQEGIVRILTVARLHWKKGLDYGLLALRELKQRGIRLEYTIVGNGPDWERLHFARHQLGLEEEVRFCGRLPHDAVPKLLWEHDIYLQPSVQEGFCNAVLEAQAAGMLCLVSDAEGLAENVVDGQTGWVTPRRDFQALAERIWTTVHLPNEKLLATSANATQRIRKHFRIEQQIDAFEAFYQ